MRTRPAVAVTVLAALAGTTGIVVEVAFSIPTPTRPGVAQPEVWALAYAKGGRQPSEVTRA